MKQKELLKRIDEDFKSIRLKYDFIDNRVMSLGWWICFGGFVLFAIFIFMYASFADINNQIDSIPKKVCHNETEIVKMPVNNYCYNYTGSWIGSQWIDYNFTTEECYTDYNTNLRFIPSEMLCEDGVNLTYHSFGGVTLYAKNKNVRNELCMYKVYREVCVIEWN